MAESFSIWQLYYAAQNRPECCYSGNGLDFGLLFLRVGGKHAF